MDTELLKDALPKIVTELPGPQAQALIERRSTAIPATIACGYPCVIARGAGAMLEDVDGNIFLDWVGGVGVLNLGYSHPKVVAAVSEQALRYFHGMMNIVTHQPYIALAEQMNRIVPTRSTPRQTMFANSGAEAIENAVKLARGATGRPNILVFNGAFHGRTLMAVHMTGKRAYSEGLGPFPDGVYRVDFPYLYRRPEGMSEEEAVRYYLTRLEDALLQASPPAQTAAFVLEPVQGEGGFIPAPFAWVEGLRALCDRHGILLIADEIQTGFARSGKMFVSNWWAEGGFAPDIITSAKSIAAGLPLSAVTASQELFDSLPPGLLGGTYGGNPLACVAGLEVIAAIERDGLCERSAEIAERARAAFSSWQEEFEQLGDVRGIGGMLGMEFVKSRVSKEPDAALVTAIVKHAAQRGLLVEAAGIYGNVLRFLSPLVITDLQLEAGLSILHDTIAQLTARA
ncbi:MAG: aspartate aminotransferase family protein [Coriobacteriales bacterium]|jgi:4-aminobutyrate aminotransferase/(S)-3-amino-2-methylpropionate transaminase|nr:aspartate aminotransferase family protein [Coriobacteriales bacterium]